jgi:hypothetical protein
VGKRLTATALGVALAIAAPSAHAADVELSGSGVDKRALDDLIRLELGPSTALDRIVVRVADGHAEVELHAKERRRRGTVALPRGQEERTIALFVGELARRFDAEPEAVPPEPPPLAPVAPPDLAERPEPAPPPPPATRDSELAPFVLATMGARWLAAGGDLVATPRIEAGLSPSRALRLGILARYGYARSSDVLGTARAHLVSGGVAATHSLASAIATGPRVEIGGVFARGEGSSGASASAVALVGAWELELRLRVAGAFTMLATVEAGWHARGLDLRADDRTVLEISGPFAGASLGGALFADR